MGEAWSMPTVPSHIAERKPQEIDGPLDDQALYY